MVAIPTGFIRAREPSRSQVMNIVLFEDHLVDQLSPVTLTRPTYSISCGSLRLVDIARAISPNMFGVVRGHLADFQADYLGTTSVFDRTASTLWINARTVPDANLIASIRANLGRPFSVTQNGQIVLALTAPGYEFNATLAKRAVVYAYLSSRDLPAADIDARLIDYPHTLISQHSEVLIRNLVLRIAAGSYTEIADKVFAAEGVQLPSNVAIHTDNGPVVLERGITIGDFAVINGPVHLGQNTKITAHALLKGPISIGHSCKIGGEVTGSIVEPYSNKVHCGYLGTSYVGSWVNLGAGTSNSNLKNSYGNIRIQYGDRKVDTGMQFLGCVIGDFTKTAINTSIYTGKILGVCSNVYGNVTTNVPSFANYARSFGEMTEHPAEVMEVAQKRGFRRRGVEQENRHKQLLRAIYEMEAPKRKLANQPPSL